MNDQDYSLILLEAKILKRLSSATGVAYPTGYLVFRALIIGISRIFIRTELCGQEQIPQPGGVKYRPHWYLRNSRSKVANHGEIWDIPFIGMFHRGLVWICKPAFCKNWLLAMINQRMGAVPIFRPSIDGKLSDKNTSEEIEKTIMSSYIAEEGISVAVRALQRGVPVEMFPEATRAGKSVVDHSRNGTARISRLSGAPIVPIAMAGCSRGDPVVRAGVLRRKVIIGVVCEPIYPADFSYLKDDAAINSAIMMEWELRINAGRSAAIEMLGRL